jgi:acetyl esterase/lipase
VNSTYSLLSALVVVLLTNAGTVNAQSLKPDRRFTEWDRNRDGKLARQELPTQLRKNFARVDADKDGFISLTEHLRFLGRGKGQANARQSRRNCVSDRVTLRQDLPYADTDNSRQKLDLLLPKKPATNGPLPVVVFIHGGGWRNGDKSRGLGQVSRFAESGQFAAASIGYRLSGEAKWPAQIHDCKAAIRWLKANAKQYELDAKRICVFGTSAGGHLVAMLGATGGVETLEGKLGSHTERDSRVACVVDFFGPTDFLTMNDFPGRIDHDAATSPESLLIGGPIQQHKDKSRAATPMMYVTADDAPILIMHGTQDPLVPFDQSVQFLAALKRSKVDAVLAPITDGEHGFRGPTVNARVDQFLKKYLLGKEVVVSSEAIKP